MEKSLFTNPPNAIPLNPETNKHFVVDQRESRGRTSTRRCDSGFGVRVCNTYDAALRGFPPHFFYVKNALVKTKHNLI